MEREIIVNTNSLLTALAGIGQYTYQVSRALKSVDTVNKYTYYYGFFSNDLFCRDEEKDSLRKSVKQFGLNLYKNVKTAVKQIPVVGSMAREVRTGVSKTLQKIQQRSFDLYFEPNFIPLEEIQTKKTVTMIFDLSVPLHPEWHPKERIEIFDRHFQKGLKRTDLFLTATQFIKKQMVDHLHIPQEKIFVTPISCNKDIFRPQDTSAQNLPKLKSPLPDRYFLFVGSVEPRKNLMALLKAYAMLPPPVQSQAGLVFCGPSGWMNSEVYKFIDSANLKNRVTFLKYVTDDLLAMLYARAEALVYPSFYEGFGLPPLEAMCCACPAIVSDIPPHRELCAESALYVNPHNPEEIARAMQSLLENPDQRRKLIDDGLKRSAHFDWNKTARETLKVFEAAFNSGG